jgi:hypothetical protein
LLQDSVFHKLSNPLVYFFEIAMNAIRLAVTGAFVVATALVASHSAAQIYKHVDPVTGITEYSNLPPKKGAVRMVGGDTLSEIPTGNRANKTRSGTGEARTVNTSTGGNNSAGKPDAAVDNSTQKTRDGTRKQVLLDELTIEEKSLQDAKLAHNSGKPLPLYDESAGSPKYIDRIKQIEKNMRHHERNVSALKQEIANLKL